MSVRSESTPRVWYDPECGTLRGPNGERQLSPKAASVLCILIQAPGQVVSKDELLAEVWPDVAVNDGVLSTVIYELRQALGETASKPRYLETLRKRGYRWIGSPPAKMPPGPPRHSWSIGRSTVRRPWRVVASIAVLTLGLTIGAYYWRTTTGAGGDLVEPSSVACDLFLRGVRAASEGSPESVRRAIERLERAAALEPKWAPAQLALAESYLEIGTPPAIERAVHALERAENLGGNAADLSMLRAALRLRVERDPEGAERELRRARERSTCGGERIDLQVAETLSALGRHDEAVALLRKLAQDQPGAVDVQRALGRSLVLAGRLRDAEESVLRSLETVPHHVPSLRRLASIRARLRDDEGSWQATRREAYALRRPPDALEALDAAWRRSGLSGVQRWRLEQAEALGLDSVERAAIWAELGELERAARELRVAHSARAIGLVWVSVDPVFAALRQDRRYRHLVSEVTRPAPLSHS